MLDNDYIYLATLTLKPDVHETTSNDTKCEIPSNFIKCETKTKSSLIFNYFSNL